MGWWAASRKNDGALEGIDGFTTSGSTRLLRFAINGSLRERTGLHPTLNLPPTKKPPKRVVVWLMVRSKGFEPLTPRFVV